MDPHQSIREQNQSNTEAKAPANSRIWQETGKKPPLQNLLISNVVIGRECQMREFAQWCHESGEHIIVASVLQSAWDDGWVQELAAQATVVSLRTSLLQHGAVHRGRIR